MYMNSNRPGPASAEGVTVNGVAHRCGAEFTHPSSPRRARCEAGVGHHDGPNMTHVGRDQYGTWLTWPVKR